ncbi:MAG: insulinase family protein [Candidatus Latescibacteria bacterium]|nr:insulinase family protein [Candidatus Latescibacterota bacterium]
MKNSAADPSTSDDSYRRTVLDNGMVVITEALPFVRSVALGVWSLAGSRDERPGAEGTAHFLEHMFFKGTEKRSAFDIAYELERLGGFLNAFTAKDHTCYFARILDEHLPVAVDVLSDMIQNAVLDPQELEKEKQVVQEEIKTSIDTPDEWVHELFLMDLYGGHPLAHPVLGGEKTVSFLSSEDLREFVYQRYRPDNILVAAAGSLEHDQVVELVSESFVHLNPDAVKPRHPMQPDGRGSIELHPRDISQAHVILGGRGLHYLHDDRYILAVLMNLLAGGMSSRLFQSLREERGLVYTISAVTSFFEETGTVGFYFACAPENTALALNLIHEELNTINAGKKVDEEELTSAKEQVKGHLMLALENTFNRMSRLAKGLLFEDRIVSLDEILTNLEAVTGTDLSRVTGELMAPEMLTTTMLGAVDGIGNRAVGATTEGETRQLPSTQRGAGGFGSTGH